MTVVGVKDYLARAVVAVAADAVAANWPREVADFSSASPLEAAIPPSACTSRSPPPASNSTYLV